jgi:outer membrane receptor protein involved in Fe transport
MRYRKMMQKLIVLVGLLVFLLFSILPAATTGKIAGIVIDSETKEPLPGVNIVLSGTLMGAATDQDGAYFIINIPPGEYALESTMLGYTNEVVSNVRVNVDRTTIVDLDLTPTTLQLGDEVVVVAERERVKTDVSFSQATVTNEDILDIPTTPDIREVIALSPGIYRNDKGHIEIRGGRMDEVGVFVDDISMSNQRDGMPIFNLPDDAIQEIQIIRGGFSAEFGQAQSGIINIVTKSSQQAYHGSIDFQYAPTQQKHFGPNYFSPDYFWGVGRFLSRDSVWIDMPWRESDSRILAFQGWDSWWTNTPPEGRVDKYDLYGVRPYGQTVEDAIEIWKYRHRPQEYSNEPDYNIDATLSGPVPLLANKLSFFVTGHYNRTTFPFKFYKPSYNEYSTNLKLIYDLSNNITLQYQGIYSNQEGASSASGAVNMADPRQWTSAAIVMGEIFGTEDGTTFYAAESNTKLNRIRRYNNTLKFKQVLNRSSFYEVQLTHSLTKETTTRDIPFRDYTNIIKVIGGDSLDIAPLGYSGFVDGTFWAPSDVLGYNVLGGTASLNRNEDYSWNESLSLKADYVNQVNNIHQIKAGIWGLKNTIKSDYGVTNQAQLYDGTPEIPDPPDRYKRQWIVRTIPYSEFSAYIQDKIEFEGMILNAGVRMDGVTTDQVVLPVWSDAYISGNVEGDVAELETESPKSKTRFYLSPRLGVSHPLGESSKLFFNYGYFYQRATINQLYENIYNPGTITSISRIANPNLEFRKTIQYELGFEQMVRNLFQLTVSGYYRDGSNGIASTTFLALNGDDWSRSYNTAFSDIKGFEVEVRFPQNRFIGGWVNYDYRTKTTGRYGFRTFWQDPLFEPLAADATPTVTRATPQFRANIVLRSPIAKSGGLFNAIFSDILASFLYQWRAGEWITYHHPLYWPGDDNRDPGNLQWKSFSRLDLKISKAVDVSGSRFEIYADIRNLLNKKYLWPSLLNRMDQAKEYTYFTSDEYLEEIGKLGLQPGDVENSQIQQMLNVGAYMIYYGEPRLYHFGIRISL